jgi:hypothetical protein
MLELLTFVNPARQGRPAKNEVFAPTVRIVSRDKWVGVFARNAENAFERIAKFKGEDAEKRAGELRDSIIAKAREAVEARNAEILAHNAAEAARLAEAEERAKAALAAEAALQNGAAPVAEASQEEAAPVAEASQEEAAPVAEASQEGEAAPVLSKARNHIARRPARKPRKPAGE